MCALEPSRETYRILYGDNPSMYFAVAADGTVLSVNRYGAGTRIEVRVPLTSASEERARETAADSE